jgi:hypothetical protein
LVSCYFKIKTIDKNQVMKWKQYEE